MKSTESIDDAGKLVDLSSATGETAMPGDTLSIENKRRRLIRGAVAFAPLVLTLRSGTLAAASCTGARLVKIGENGLFAGNEGDVCILETDANICPTYPNVYPTRSSYPPVQTKIITQPENTIPATKDSPGYYFCNKLDGTKYNKVKMAILSSHSATSLIG